MSMNFEIGKRRISKKHPPYIVAEISANHNGDIKNAFKIIEMAKRCGADAVKIQTYTPDTITLKSNKDEFIILIGNIKINKIKDKRKLRLITK